MLSYKEGMAAAFDELYARHKGGLYRYVLRQLNNHEELAKEIFQDVWMNLIKARINYLVTAKFSTWLYRLAHNRLVDYWRSNKVEKLKIEYEESGVDADDALIALTSNEPQSVLQQTQTQQQLKQAIAALPEEQRSALLLKEDAALSLAQIAEVTGVKRETVKSRLRYGIKRLQGILHPLRPLT